MPIRWNSDNDQHLLLKILETCNVTVDYAAIANAWEIGDEKPTAKAISERIAKLKRLSKGIGTISTPATPRKSKTPAPGRDTPKSRAKTPKRKHDVLVEPEPEGDDDEDEDLPIPVKVETDIEASPTKKAKIVEDKTGFDDEFSLGRNSDEDNHEFDGEDSLGPNSNDDKLDGYDGTGEYMTPDEMSEMW